MPTAKTAPTKTKGDDTRERIVRLAAPVFNQKGYSGASLADLLEATGMQKGGLYNHFESKEELAVAAFEYACGFVVEHWRRAMADKKHAADRLLTVVDLFDMHLRDSAIRGGCPLMNTAVESDDANPVLRKRAQQAADTYRSTIARVVELGMERGELRAGLDPEKVATVLLSTLEGGLMLGKLYGKAECLRVAQGHMRDWIRNELRA